MAPRCLLDEAVLLVLEERGEADDAGTAGDGRDDGRGHAALVERLAVELRGARGSGARARSFSEKQSRRRRRGAWKVRRRAPFSTRAGLPNVALRK